MGFGTVPEYLWAPPGLGFDVTGHSSGTWVPAKDVVHITVNRVSGALRGRSDLAPVLPWRYTNWVDDRVVQNSLKTAFVWDVTLKGAGRSEISAARAANAAAPARAARTGHGNLGEAERVARSSSTDRSRSTVCSKPCQARMQIRQSSSCRSKWSCTTVGTRRN